MHSIFGLLAFFRLYVFLYVNFPSITRPLNPLLVAISSGMSEKKPVNSSVSSLVLSALSLKSASVNFSDFRESNASIASITEVLPQLLGPITNEEEANVTSASLIRRKF